MMMTMVIRCSRKLHQKITCSLSTNKLECLSIWCAVCNFCFMVISVSDVDVKMMQKPALCL